VSNTSSAMAGGGVSDSSQLAVATKIVSWLNIGCREKEDLEVGVANNIIWTRSQ